MLRKDIPTQGACFRLSSYRAPSFQTSDRNEHPLPAGPPTSAFAGSHALKKKRQWRPILGTPRGSRPAKHFHPHLGSWNVDSASLFKLDFHQSCPFCSLCSYAATPYPLDIFTGISWHFVPVTDVDALFLEILCDQLSSPPPCRRQRYHLTRWRHGRVLLLHRASLAVRASNDRRRPGLASTSSARSAARPAHSEPRRSRPRHLSDLCILHRAHGSAYARFPRAD